MQLLALLPLASLAWAQSSASSASSSASSTSTGTAAVATQTVAVGQGGALRFIPEVVNVQTGGKVIFQFYPQNHSVTQGDFSNPCQPNSNGFNSGFVAVSNASVATSSPKTFTVNVNDNNPIWVYCAQAKHCQTGMAMVINPSATSQQQLSVYRNNAQNVTSAAIPSSVRGGTLSGVSGTNTTTNGTTGTTSGSGTSGSAKPSGSDAVKTSAAWVVALFAAIMASVVAF